MNTKILILLVGPSASGKSHLQSYLREQGLSIVVSTTTREARPGEVNNIDYQFIDEYKSKLHEENSEFVELVVYNGVRYGVVLPELEKKFQEGNGVAFLVVEPTGLPKYKAFCASHCINVITIFIDTPPIVRFERLKQLAYKYVEELDYTGGTCDYYTESGVDRIIRSAIYESDWATKHEWDYVLIGEKSVEFNYQLIKDYILGVL